MIGEEDVVDYTKKPDLLERISKRIGVAMASALSGMIVNGTVSLH